MPEGTLKCRICLIPFAFYLQKPMTNLTTFFDLGGGTGTGEGGLPCFKEVSPHQLFQGVKSSKWLL